MRTRQGEVIVKNKNDRAYEIPFEDYDFSNPPMLEYDPELDTVENIKRKAVMIRYAQYLTDSDQINDATLYLKYLSNNSYFANDYYPYRCLSGIYDKTGDYAAELVNIKRLFHAKIYLNDYQLTWFNDRIRQLMEETSASEYELQGWIDYYQFHGALNKKRLNPFLSERFKFSEDKIIVISMDEFSYNQDVLALEKTGLIYESVGNLDLAVTHYSNIISSGEYNCCRFYYRLCRCLEKMGDYQREAKAIKLYFRLKPPDRTISSDEWFQNSLESVEHKLKSSLDYYF